MSVTFNKLIQMYFNYSLDGKSEMRTQVQTRRRMKEQALYLVVTVDTR